MSKTEHTIRIVVFNFFEFICCYIKVKDILWYFYSYISTVIHDFIQYYCNLLYIIENFTTGRLS